MNRYYKKNALLATTYKIERLKNESGFFRRNIIKITAFGIGFSFYAPTYTDHVGKSVMQRLEMSYGEACLVVASVFAFFCLLGHTVWTLQEKNQMKRLLRKKLKLEKELGKTNE